MNRILGFIGAAAIIVSSASAAQLPPKIEKVQPVVKLHSVETEPSKPGKVARVSVRRKRSRGGKQKQKTPQIKTTQPKKAELEILVQGVPGCDVSEYEKQVDWAQVAKDKKFAFMRVSHGLYRDATFAANWKGAKDHGVIRGAYHYLDPKEPYAPQLKYFVKTLKLEKGDLAPVLDLENPSLWAHMKRSNRIRYVQKWIRALEHVYGVKPIIYMSPSFVDGVLGLPEALVLKDYPLWIANYHVARPTIPLPWTSYIAWQYTEKGKCPGVTGNCDLNVAPGKLEDLQRYAVQSTSGGDDTILTAVELDDEGLSARDRQDEPRPPRVRRKTKGRRKSK